MRSVWSCGPCVLLLLSAVQPAGRAAASRADKDGARVVDKVHVVVVQHARRAAAGICPARYSLCPASRDGGCCPDGYACAASHCYATAAAAASACGRAGYLPCGADVGGGCCPAGYICGVSDCTAPAGASISQDCPRGYYLCPSSYNYGCCRTGYGCAPNACYATAPRSYVFTYTTTAGGGAGGGAAETITSTAVITPAAPSGLPTGDASAAFPKFIPTTVGKVPATASPSTPGGGDDDEDGSGGLSTAQLGGIVGGAAALLLAVLLAAFLVLRRLRSAVRAVESPGGSGGGGGGGGGPPAASRARPGGRARFRPTTSEVDAMDVDPLMEQPQPAPPSSLGYPGRSRSASELSSGRHAGTARYFDIPRVHNVPGRHAGSVVGGADPQGQYAYAPVQQKQRQQRGRLWSDASELSAGSGGGSGPGSPLAPAELDAAGGVVPELPGADADGPGGGGRRLRRASGAAGPYSAGIYAVGASPGAAGGWPSLAAAREGRRGDGHGSDGSDGSVQPPPAPAGLGVVEEDSEMVRGHHEDAAAGQATTGLGACQAVDASATPQLGR